MALHVLANLMQADPDARVQVLVSDRRALKGRAALHARRAARDGALCGPSPNPHPNPQIGSRMGKLFTDRLELGGGKQPAVVQAATRALVTMWTEGSLPEVSSLSAIPPHARAPGS